MARVTSKLQVTVPKAIADRFRIRPGDDIEWRAEGNAIRVLPRVDGGAPLDRAAGDGPAARRDRRPVAVHRAPDDRRVRGGGDAAAVRRPRPPDPGRGRAGDGGAPRAR